VPVIKPDWEQNSMSWYIEVPDTPAIVSIFRFS